MGRDGNRDDWPVIPPSGWRPPGMKEQAGLIAGVMAVTALITDVLIVIAVRDSTWGGHAAWLWRALSCAALPINLTAAGWIVLWLFWRKRRRNARW